MFFWGNMKFRIFAIAMTFQLLVTYSIQALANLTSPPCTQNCVETEAIPVMEKAILGSNPATSAYPDCPPAGSKIFKSVLTSTGKATTSAKVIRDLAAQSAPKREALQNDHSHCGVCKQTNLVSTFTTSAPNHLKTDQVCATPFARNFQRDLNNQDIEVYAGDTLRGKNAQGQQFTAECSNTCNLYTATGQTPLSSGTSRLNLTILCGPPRTGTILTATYDLSVGFVHQWVCSK